MKTTASNPPAITAGSWVSPLSDGSFPVIPSNTLIHLALGNGTACEVMVSPVPGRGMLFSVVSCGRMGGAYCFAFAPSYAYVGEKLRLLDGDAICFARFIRDQLDAESESASLLWVFRFVGGGFNQVSAHRMATAEEIVEAARGHCGEWADKIDRKSIRALYTKAERDAYYAAMPSIY